MRHEPYPDCPGEELVREVAAEIAPPEIARSTLQHISQCDHCGPLLKRYREAFSEERLPEIEAVLGHMPSAGEKARRKQAKEIAGRIAKAEPKPPSFWQQIHAWSAGLGARALAGATALALAIAGSVVWGPAAVNAWDFHREQKLVAAAFAERRTTEMRLPSVDYGEYRPLSKTLGSNDGLDLERPKLLEATGELAKKLNSGDKLDPRWLQIKGRIALLTDPGAAKSAEEAFEEAQSQGLNDPGLDIDLAVSYFERAAAGDGLNVTRTIDLLEKVLKHPKLNADQRSVALFDLAIAYEKIQAWDLAVANWEKYLAEDRSSGPWAQEAQERLKKAKEKLPLPKTSDFREPGFFLRHSTDENVLNDIEQFQEFAFGEWLPKAMKNPQGDAAQAVATIARVMQQRHDDTWWKDFLRAAGPQDLTAVQAFSEAYTADRNDLHFRSLEQSRRAAAAFAASGNRAGELMALFQQVYALQRLADGPKCFDKANILWDALRNTGYRWLQAQVALERATCANLSSNFQLVDASVEQSRHIADASRSDFPELRLRILGLEASMLRLQGKYSDAWKLSISGLSEFWSGSYSEERLYQFYSVMRQCARNVDAIHAAEALLRQSIYVLKQGAPLNSGFQALLYLRLANVMLEQDNAAGAKEAEAARQLLEAAHAADGTAAIFDAAARIELASFDLRRKQSAQALAELNEAAKEIAAGDNFLRLEFYRALGRAELQLNNLDSAMAAYEQAVRIADDAFRSLKEGEGQVQWMQSTDEVYRGVVEVLLAKRDDENALAVWEWARNKTFQKATPRRVGDLLRDSAQKLGSTLSGAHQDRLIYASFENKLQIWAVQGRRIHSVSTPLSQPELSRRVRQFVKSCSSVQGKQVKNLDAQSSELYRLLIEPAISLLPSSDSLAIEMDDPMAALPLEALKGSDGSYFGESYSFIYSPGLFVETALRQPSALQPSDRLLAIDGSMVSDSLPGHETATEAVRKVKTQIKLVPAPLAVGVLRSELQDAAAVSFFGHAVPKGTGAALKLGPDAFMTARELDPKLLKKMKIAVLAACSSGSAEKGLLDSGSLVRAFLAGGVPTVLSSRWNVESRSTAQFVEKFYSHLAFEPAPLAMRNARKEMRLQNPYYWAGFSLTGRIN